MEEAVKKFELGPIQTKWVESLEQHPERQAKSILGRKTEGDTYRVCCLGEGGLIAGVCVWVNGILRVKDDDGTPGSSQVLNGRVNGKSAFKYLGLYGPIGDASIYESGPKQPSLAHHNDHLSTWPQIAALLRENPEIYFKESV